ncbi:MAG: DUF1538 domain-containing protein [Rhodospirillales bacterium]|nr:DUF1538 domain-containing protein [Rhodospirillales bacterium]
MTGGLIEEIEATAWSVILAISPLIVLFLAFQVFVLKLPRQQAAAILKGTIIAALGLFLFLLGIGIGFLPFGRVVGEALGRLDAIWLSFLATFVLGFLTAWGEPAVRILADQVEDASSGAIRARLVVLVVSIGVAFWVGLGMVRIAYGIPILYLVVPGYLFVIGLVWLCDREFLMVAIDSGGVATGPLANSFLLALALGASAAVRDQDLVIYGFGFVALIAIAPITSVMMLGVAVRFKARNREQKPVTRSEKDAEPVPHR